MRVTIVPASTKTAAATIRCLLESPQQLPADAEDGAAPASSSSSTRAALPEIYAVYRNAGKAPPEEFTSRPNFHGVVGDVSDAESLDFKGSDVVLAITPPVYDGRDMFAHAEAAAKNVRAAVEGSGSVKRVVLLSSGGAQFENGVGEIKTNHIAERVFSATTTTTATITTTKTPAAAAYVLDLVFVRCAFFMENWTISLETLKKKGPDAPFFYSTITPLEWSVPMVATRDIGRALATELLRPLVVPSSSSSSPWPYIYELHGPERYSPLDVRDAFSEALSSIMMMTTTTTTTWGDQPPVAVEVKPVERDELPAYYSRLFPPQIVGSWVEMATSFLPGGLLAPDTTDFDNRPIVKGETGLREAIKAAVAQGW